jgi:hypothetical protein
LAIMYSVARYVRNNVFKTSEIIGSTIGNLRSCYHMVIVVTSSDDLKYRE